MKSTIYKKYTFEIEVPIMEGFKECCDAYETSQKNMINDVLLKFIKETEIAILELKKELENEAKNPKLFLS